MLAPLKLQKFEIGSEWNLLKPQPSFRLYKLASGVPVDTVTKLMLMPTQVNAFSSSHYQPPIKQSTALRKQVEYDDGLLKLI